MRWRARANAPGDRHRHEQSKESQASGAGPCIHHFAIEVEDLQQAEQQIKSCGPEIISDPGVIPIKFRAPGGTVVDLVPVGRYKQPHSQ
jgi:lactoylglutathione lyase